MPKNKVDFTGNIMSKIKTDKIKMRPKWYFWLGSLLLFIALVSLVIVSIFSVSLITFSLRSHGPMGEVRYQQLIASFPVWAVVAMVIGMATGVLLLKKYDFAYKKNFALIVLFFLLAVFAAGILIDLSGLDAFWMRGPFRIKNSPQHKNWNRNLF